MAETAIDLQSSHRQEADGSHTVTLTVSGIPTLGWSQRVSDWLRDLIRQHANEIGRLSKERADAAIGEPPMAIETEGFVDPTVGLMNEALETAKLLILARRKHWGR